MYYCLFLLSFDEFFKDAMNGATNMGVPPSLYLVPEVKKKEVHNIARKSVIMCKEKHAEDPLPFFESTLQKEGIECIFVGDIPYLDRQDKFLCDIIEVENV